MNHYEILVALVAPRGINVDTIIVELEGAIGNYGYDVERINLLDITSNAQVEVTGRGSRNEVDYEGTRLTSLRKYLLEAANPNKTDDSQYLNPHKLVSSLIVQNVQRRRASKKTNTVYIIDNIKHPDELVELKKVYKNALYTIGVTDSLIGRIETKKRQFLEDEEGLKEHGAVRKSVEYIVEDYDNRQNISICEIPTNKENIKIDVSNKVRDAYLLSDFFINLNSADFELVKDEKQLTTLLKQSVERFVDLMFGAPNVTPTKQEHSMFLAYTSALRSGDLSRQVGSAIVNDIHDVIAMGANEVPKSGGGQYWANSEYIADTDENKAVLEQGQDQRDFILGHDTNATVKNTLTKDLVQLLIDKQVIPEQEKENATKVLQKSSLKDITEYGRVVHAEMSALMSAARNGTHVKGMHMFCTTYPCHNCAKHLVAAGIKKVHYIEPYPKSKAVASHEDSIFDPDSMNIGFNNGEDQEAFVDEITAAFMTDSLEKSRLTNDKDIKKLIFEPFSGVGPSRYVDLFSMNMGNGEPIKRKSGSQSLKLNRKQIIKPRVPIIAEHNHFYEQELFGSIKCEAGEQFQQISRIALDLFHKDKELKSENHRQNSTIKHWFPDEEYGYISSEVGDDFPFNGQNIADREYCPKRGDDVSFLLKKGKTVIFADQIKKLSHIENNATTSPSNTISKQQTSTIQHWIPEEKYGFIIGPKENYYFRIDWVSDCSINKLVRGREVSFEPTINNNGQPQAVKVKVID